MAKKLFAAVEKLVGAWSNNWSRPERPKKLTAISSKKNIKSNWSNWRKVNSGWKKLLEKNFSKKFDAVKTLDWGVFSTEKNWTEIKWLINTTRLCLANECIYSTIAPIAVNFLTGSRCTIFVDSYFVDNWMFHLAVYLDFCLCSDVLSLPPKILLIFFGTMCRPSRGGLVYDQQICCFS